MSGHIYILTDGVNTKIGITTSLEKRLASYSTHNPSFYTFKVYETAEIDEAKRIEAVVKLYFREKLTGSGKEWFAVTPEQVDRIVAVFLEPTSEEVITPAMHGLRPPSELGERLQKVVDALKNRKGYNSNESYRAKEHVADLFSSSFKLGIPEHRIPEGVVKQETLAPDLNNSDNGDERLRKAVRTNLFQIPYDDHTFNFFHLVKLASGSYVAMGTAKVSMPYLKAVEGKRAEIRAAANAFGWYAFDYDEWSWHAPNETGLILFTQKTPVQSRKSHWQNSFRRWVIERSKLLTQASSSAAEFDVMVKTVGDICDDSTFPLHVKSARQLYDEYLYPFFGITWNDEPLHFMQAAYERLFERWAVGS